MTTIKLFAMTHSIPVVIKNNDAMLFYKTVAKLIGRRLDHNAYGYVIS